MTDTATKNTSRPHSIGAFLQSSLTVKIVLAVVVVGVISLLFPRGIEYQYEYTAHDIWVEDDLIAPFAFSIYRDPTIVEQERREAARNTPLSFDRYPGVARAVQDSVDRMLRLMQNDARIVRASMPRRVRSEDIALLADSLSRANARDPRHTASAGTALVWVAPRGSRVSSRQVNCGVPMQAVSIIALS